MGWVKPPESVRAVERGQGVDRLLELLKRIEPLLSGEAGYLGIYAQPAWEVLEEMRRLES